MTAAAGIAAIKNAPSDITLCVLLAAAGRPAFH